MFKNLLFVLFFFFSFYILLSFVFFFFPLSLPFSPPASLQAIMPEAYFTLLYNDVYLPGALVLAQALRRLWYPHAQLAVLVGSQVSDYAISRLHQVFDHVVPTETISNSAADAPQFQLLGRPELERSYTKVHVWRQTQFSRIVFLDADTLPLRNLDGLFSEDEYPLDSSTPIAASPDIGWPDIFNSGVFVTLPSVAIYDTLVGRAKAGLSFDGGDQGLLNEYFEGRWKQLPFYIQCHPIGLLPVHAGVPAL